MEYFIEEGTSLKVLESLIHSDFDFDIPDGNKLINWACKTGKIEIILTLMPTLKQGKIKYINYETFDPGWNGWILVKGSWKRNFDIRYNPLANACMNGHEDIAELLITNGKSIGLDLKHEYWRNSYRYENIVTIACGHSKPAIVKLIFEAAKNCSYKFINESDFKPAFVEKNGNDEIVQLCLEYAEDLAFDLSIFAPSKSEEESDSKDGDELLLKKNGTDLNC